MSREFNSDWLRNYQMKTAKQHNAELVGEAGPITDPLGPLKSQLDYAPKEIELHKEIMDWCDAQWPRWKYIRARSDQKSTIAVGAQDFTIFTPGGRVLCVECKRSGTKQDRDQLCWATELRILGHTVHVVRSLDEFLKLT